MHAGKAEPPGELINWLTMTLSRALCLTEHLKGECSLKRSADRRCGNSCMWTQLQVGKKSCVRHFLQDLGPQLRHESRLSFNTETQFAIYRGGKKKCLTRAAGRNNTNLICGCSVYLHSQQVCKAFYQLEAVSLNLRWFVCGGD